MLLMDGYNDCIVGVIERCGQDRFVVYDPEKVMLQLMAENDWDHETAAEWLDFNMAGAWVGSRSPGFLAPYVEEEEHERSGK